MNATPMAMTPFHELPRLARVALLLLAAAAIALSIWLWPAWRHNPDLSHGIFMPVIFAVLIHESRHQTPRFVRSGGGTRAAFAVLLVLALGALVAAGLYAASVDWSHPLVDGSLTTALVCLLGAGLIVFAHERLRFVGFNWAAFVAVVLWLPCAPIPLGTYSRLTLTLQLWVSETVLRTLHLLAIPAIRHGNVIELARATVGVEEACSGVRSLISCVFAALFFSATLVRRPWARVVIVVLSVPLALGMNFLRSLTLTLVSNRGINITGPWHDLTGFAVLGVTAALLAGLALWLGRSQPPAPTPGASAAAGRSPSAQLVALIATLTTAAVLVFLAAANTRPSIRSEVPVPDLLSLLPASAAGWQVSTSDDLYQFRDALQTDHLAQRIYRKPTPDGVVEVIIYAAYWRAGQAPVSLVASHTPDACWPGSGWQGQPVPQPRVTLAVDHREIPDAEYRLFTFNGFPQYVWFWHLYDGHPIEFRDPYSPVALLRIAWKYGFRHDGDQLFIRVSSNRAWKDLEHEPLLVDFFHRTREMGL